MNKLTIKQGMAVVASLVQNVNWDELDMDVLQTSVIRDPKGAGAQFTLFLKNGARVSIGDMKIVPAPFDPVSFLGPSWSIIPDEHDGRNDGLPEIDFNKVDLVICLKKDETSITGEEVLKRLKKDGRIRYGVNAFMGLWEDFCARKENSVLKTRFRSKGIKRLYFFGDVLLGPGGGRWVLCLYWRGGGDWGWSYEWLDGSCGARHWSAVSSQVSA